MIKTNTFIDDWLEEAWQRGIEEGRQEGIDEGRQEGRQEGELHARRQLLLLLLEHQFGTVPVRLVLRIDNLTVDERSRLFDLAPDASSLEGVEQAINEMVA